MSLVKKDLSLNAKWIQLKKIHLALWNDGNFFIFFFYLQPMQLTAQAPFLLVYITDSLRALYHCSFRSLYLFLDPIELALLFTVQ